MDNKGSFVSQGGWLFALLTVLAGAAFVPLLFASFTLSPPAEAAQATNQAPAPPQPAATPRLALPTNVPAFDPDGAEYVLLAWSDSGMRLATACDEVFSLSTPLVSLRAQLVKRGPSPALISHGVVVTYQVEGMRQPSAAARLWEFSESLLGKKLAVDAGPTGLGQRGTMAVADTIFSAVGIPIPPLAADGSFLPYPLVRIEAVDAVTGKLLAVTKTAAPVSTELGCAKCHGGDASKPGLSADTARRILEAHDRLSKTTLAAEAKAGKPRSCDSCHADVAPAGKEAGLLSLSASLHGFHAAKLANKGAEACGFCHPVKGQTRQARDNHARRGADCGQCHGAMEDHALALLKAEDGAGKKSALVLAAKFKASDPGVPARKAPGMQADCAGCHDFARRPDVSSDRAFGKWTKEAADLYHRRKDLAGGLACAACHGPAHAVYPSENPFGRDRDAIAPMQYQGMNKPLGAMGACNACHKQDMDPATSVHHPLPAMKAALVTVPQGATLRRPRVLFPHAAHNDMDCKVCHHKGYVDGQGLACAVPGCHDQFEAKEGPRMLRAAFHGKGFSCNACHQERRKAGAPAGPVDCVGCHTVVK